jgi:hypothetical protein
MPAIRGLSELWRRCAGGDRSVWVAPTFPAGRDGYSTTFGGAWDTDARRGRGSRENFALPASRPPLGSRCLTENP